MLLLQKNLNKKCTMVYKTYDRTLYNIYFHILTKTNYDDNFDNVYVTKNNQIAFVNSEKNYVIFV
jgi:hypothetical protein